MPEAVLESECCSVWGVVTARVMEYQRRCWKASAGVPEVAWRSSVGAPEAVLETVSIQACPSATGAFVL